MYLTCILPVASGQEIGQKEFWYLVQCNRPDFAIGVFRKSFLAANVANLPKHMDEYIHLIGKLLCHVYKWGLLKHVQMFDMSNV